MDSAYCVYCLEHTRCIYFWASISVRNLTIEIRWARGGLKGPHGGRPRYEYPLPNPHFVYGKSPDCVRLSRVYPRSHKRADQLGKEAQPPLTVILAQAILTATGRNIRKVPTEIPHSCRLTIKHQDHAAPSDLNGRVALENDDAGLPSYQRSGFGTECHDSCIPTTSHENSAAG